MDFILLFSLRLSEGSLGSGVGTRRIETRPAQQLWRQPQQAAPGHDASLRHEQGRRSRRQEARHSSWPVSACRWCGSRRTRRSRPARRL